MESNLNDVLIKIKSSKLCLKIKDIVTIHLDVINNLNISIENIYVKSFFNNNYLKMISSYNGDGFFVNDELIAIENLHIKENKRINFDLLLNYNPYESYLPIFCILYYKVNINGEYIKKQIKSNIINLNISNVSLQNFEISADKNIYSRNENIDYIINISNKGNYKANNILIKDFIPKGTCLLEDSIKVSDEIKFLLKNNSLLINEIKENTDVKINFTIKILEDNESCYVENNPTLEYEYDLCEDNKYKKNILKSNVNKVMINKGSLFSGEGEFLHIVDKEFAYVNDIINNKIIINNKNKAKIKNLYFKNSSSASLQYMKRTLFINGIPRNYDNIDDYIYIQDSAQDEIVITYKSKVIDIPLNEEVIVKSNIQYYLTEDIYNNNKLCDISSQSNIIIYGVVIDTINNTFNRYQDKGIVLIGDVINFTIEIQNIGNLDVINLVLKEILTPEIKYIENSLTIDDNNNITFDLSKSIEISRIKSKDSIKICYKAVATKITEGKAFTKSSLSYEYTLLNGTNITKVVESKSTYIKIKGADLRHIKKEVNNNVCKLGDILNFNLSVKNKGNIEALDIKIKEEYLSCFEFIEHSLYLNEKNLRDENIFEGIYLDILNSKEFFNVKYKLKLINIPKTNLVNPKTVLEYIHVLNEEKIIKKEIFKSNDISITINNPMLSIIDMNSYIDNGCLCKYCNENNECYFKIFIRNKGNVVINKIKFKQIIPNELEFINGIVKINERTLNYIFFEDLIIEKLKSEEFIEIYFSAKVLQRNNKNLKVKSIINYSFFNAINNKIESFKDELEQKIVLIEPNLKVVKKISTKYISVNKELTETLILTNEGDLLIEDITVYLNSYDFLEIIKDSIRIDDESLSEFPHNNIIKIPTLKVNERKKISFKYKVLFIPEKLTILQASKVEWEIKAHKCEKILKFKTLSNDINLSIMDNKIILEQYVSKENLLIGDSFQYFLNIKNIGNTICKNAILNINIPKGIMFVENTLNISKNLKNNLTDEGFKFYIEKISVNEIVNISLMFKVIGDFSENNIKLNSDILGDFYLESDYNAFNEERFKSENLLLNIEKIDIALNRYCDLNYVEPGDKVIITSIISNNGTLPVYNVVFSERIQPLLKLIDNSISLNGEYLRDIDIYIGLKLGTIESGKSLIISYTYEYINGGRGEIIEMEGSLHYLKHNFSSIEEERCIIKNNLINIETAMSIFKELNINGEIKLNINEPDILEISHLIVQAEVLNYYEIQTIKNTSYGNQILTGKKIIVEGMVREKFEYIIDSKIKSLYFLERETPFSTFIVIPYNDHYTDFTLTCKVKDIYFKNISSRKIFKSITVLIDGF